MGGGGAKEHLALRPTCEDVGREAKCLTGLDKARKLLSAFHAHLINGVHITGLETHYTSNLPLPAL